MKLATTAKNALWEKFVDTTNGQIDGNGYVGAAEENVLPGVNFAEIRADLLRGDGNELGGKFCAAHSSCALAVNSFGPFKVNPANLMLLGTQGAERLEFERSLPIFRGGTPPNLDVWIERDGDIVAVESKFLEYLTPKRPAFSDAYDRLAVECEPCWWEVYRDANVTAHEQFLDRAQLIKHYFGLNKYRAKNHTNLTLLYIFWEPLNWHAITECVQHRTELEAFANAVSSSQISFRWMSYNDLWEQWTAIPGLAEHARNLKGRYQVSLAGA